VGFVGVQSPSLAKTVAVQAGVRVAVRVGLSTGVPVRVGSMVAVSVAAVSVGDDDGDGVAGGGSTGVSAHGGDDAPPQTIGIAVTVAHGGEGDSPTGTQSGSNGVVVATTQGGDVLPVGSH
jgi:hypothetical protein